MAENILMPKLAMAMKQGKIVGWKANEGDWVEKGQIVMVVETEKVTYEVESPDAGFFHIVGEINETYPVEETVAQLAETEAELAELQAASPAPAVPAADTGPADTWTGETYDGKRVKASIPYTGMREAIGNHMLQSLATSAQLTTIGEIDVTELVRIRKSYLAKEKELGLRISYTDIMVYLFTQAIKSNPMVNASLVDDEIKVWEDINFGVAIVIDAGEYDSGLIVPVVKQAQDKSLLEIALTLRDLFSRARSGELLPEEVTGGTITLSNLGAFAKGWQVGTPILNQPQAAIMATGSILDKAVGVDGQIVLRPHLSISFSYDHRVLDGVPIARYYQTISDMAANPEYMLL